MTIRSLIGDSWNVSPSFAISRAAKGDIVTEDQHGRQSLVQPLTPKSLLKKGTVPLGSIDLLRKIHSLERDSPLFQQAAKPEFAGILPGIET